MVDYSFSFLDLHIGDTAKAILDQATCAILHCLPVGDAVKAIIFEILLVVLYIAVYCRHLNLSWLINLFIQDTSNLHSRSPRTVIRMPNSIIPVVREVRICRVMEPHIKLSHESGNNYI
jgi:hypothetical protein